MRQRTISGFVICAFVLGILCFSYIPAVTMTATSVLCGLCTYELARATGAIHSKGMFFLALSFSLALCFCPIPAYHILAEIALLVSIPFFAVLMKQQERFRLSDNLSNL